MECIASVLCFASLRDAVGVTYRSSSLACRIKPLFINVHYGTSESKLQTRITPLHVHPYEHTKVLNQFIKSQEYCKTSPLFYASSVTPHFLVHSTTYSAISLVCPTLSTACFPILLSIFLCPPLSHASETLPAQSPASYSSRFISMPTPSWSRSRRRPCSSMKRGRETRTAKKRV